MDKGIAKVVEALTEKLEANGIPSNIAYVSALESAIDSLSNIIASRNEKIATLNKRIRIMVCNEYHSGDCGCDAPEETLFKCSNTFSCDFPHPFKAPNYCPQCGCPGARLTQLE